MAGSERETRKPTGLPSWGVGLLTGPEKTGKTYAAAEATASDLIGRTFWLGIGESDPDEYGVLDGVDFDIVPHDGTTKDILAALRWMARQPDVDGKPTLWVVDSVTKLWDRLVDDLQADANARERAKAQKFNRSPKEGDSTITTDLWNFGKSRWANFIEICQDHAGPVLLTARQDIVSVMQGDSPTGEKVTRIKAEKTLPFEVDWIVEMPELGKAILTGAKSLRVTARPVDRSPIEKFTVDKLWRGLGMADKIGPSSRAATPLRVADLADQAMEADSLDALREVFKVAHAAGLVDEPIDDGGEPLRHLLDNRAAALGFIAEQKESA